MIRTVVFDLDGTLLDSAPDIIESLDRALEAVGAVPARRLTRSDIGPPVGEMLERLGPSLTQEQRFRAVAAFRVQYDTSTMLHTRPYDGAVECIAALRAKGRGLYVATNKPSIPTRRLLQRWFPGAIDDFVCVDSGASQPLSKGQMLESLARRHRLDPAASLIVGDGVSDLRAGKVMGWRTVAALYGYGDDTTLRDEAPDAEIRSLVELPTLLENADRGSIFLRHSTPNLSR